MITTMEGGTRPDVVEDTLARADVHEIWEDAYYRSGDARIYERAFDEIVRRVGAPPGATFLDAGCGQGYQTIRLAKRGYRVHAVDFSPAVLDVARERVERAGVSDAVQIAQENLVELSFDDESFDYVLCWGVLMHIPRVEQAVAELSRVVRRGGSLVVSEGNRRSFDALGARLLHRAGGDGTRFVSRPAGLEMWEETPAGTLMTRRADVSWLISEFARHGVVLEQRRAGEFTEAYTKLGSPCLAKAVHALNLFWFAAVRSDRLAAGSILFFRKRG